MIAKENFKSFMKPKEIKIQTNREIWGYTRVSSKQQMVNYSISEQDNDIRTFALTEKYTVTQMEGGTYESASGDFTRKEFANLINKVKISKKRPFAIAIKFINRFSRSGGNAISIVNELIEKYGVHLIETSTGLCTENLLQRNQIFHKLLEAQQENHERLARTIPGLKAFLKQGNRLGKAPFGYTTRGTRVRDFELKAAKQIIEINAQGKILKLAWQWKLQGEKDAVILNKLKGLGVELNLQQIGKIWRNPFYCGVSINRLLDEPIKGNWEPMVSEFQFLKVQSILSPSKTGMYNVSSKDQNRPLARFLICSNCGGFLTGYEVKRKRAHYYKCNSCKHVNMNANTTKASRNRGLNDTFKELLSGVVLRNDFVDMFKLQLRKMFFDLHQDTNDQLGELRKILTELEEQLTNLEKKFLFSNSVKEDVYLKYKGELEPEILNKRGLIADLENKLSNHDDFIEKAIEVCGNISKHWEFGDSANRQRIQKVVFPEGLVVVPENRAYLTNNMNQVFKLISCLSSVSEDAKKEKVGNNTDLSLSVARRRLELPTSGL